MADEGIEKGRDLDRVVAFSDGVYAIAITLLVLSIDVPEVSRDKLPDALWDLLPFVAAYALSFYVVGQSWLAHHRSWHYIVRVDRHLLQLNLLLLGVVAILPLPTELLARYGDDPLGVIIYAASMSILGLVGAATTAYAVRAGLVATRTPQHVHRHTMARGLSMPVVFGASILVAIWSPFAAMVLWLLLYPARLVLTRHYGDIYEDF